MPGHRQSRRSFENDGLFWLDALNRGLDVLKTVGDAEELRVQPGFLLGGDGLSIGPAPPAARRRLVVHWLWKDQEWLLGHAPIRRSGYSWL